MKKTAVGMKPQELSNCLLAALQLKLSAEIRLNFAEAGGDDTKRLRCFFCGRDAIITSENFLYIYIYIIYLYHTGTHKHTRVYIYRDITHTHIYIYLFIYNYIYRNMFCCSTFCHLCFEEIYL